MVTISIINLKLGRFEPTRYADLRIGWNMNSSYCGNVYPYTVTDDLVGRDKKRKDNGKEFSERDCIRKFSYHEIFCTIYVQRRFLNKHLRHPIMFHIFCSSRL